MPIVAVVNRKGGSGKSTLATHLAAYCATLGLTPTLGDVDRQQSSQTWLRLRAQQPQARGRINGWCMDARNVGRPPHGVSHMILDTPGGLQGYELARTVMAADAVLVPVGNSVFDRESAACCVAELKMHPRVIAGKCKVGAVGMRVAGSSAAKLHSWSQAQAVTLVGEISESMQYVDCAEEGLTVFDLPSETVSKELAQWQPILDWLTPVFDLRAPSDSQSASSVASVGMRGAGSAPTAVSRLTPREHQSPRSAPALRLVSPVLGVANRSAASHGGVGQSAALRAGAMSSTQTVSATSATASSTASATASAAVERFGIPSFLQRNP